MSVEELGVVVTNLAYIWHNVLLPAYQHSNFLPCQCADVPMCKCTDAVLLW